MADPSAPRVVVVADPDDARDITELLDSVGQPVAWSGSGDDETLARLGADPVDVVVLSAGIAKGDARSFARAARTDAEWDVSVVLVGETDGPVRNALDAADFEVDRFVGRPLSAKALRFAIKTSRPGVPREIPPHRSQPVAVVPGVDTTYDGLGDEPPPPRRVSQRIETATDLAIDAFLQDAMAALPESAVDEGWTDGAGNGRVATDDGDGEGNGVGPGDPGSSDEAGGPGDPAPADVADGAAPEPTGDPAPWREPTMILSGGPGGAPSASIHDVPTRPVSQEGVAAYVGAVGELDDDDELLAALDAAGDDAVGELDPPSGPMYGEQLRAKMSAMAERLFPDRDDAAAAVSAPSAADADIDLTSLGSTDDEDAAVGGGTLVPGLDDEGPVSDDAGGAPGHLQGEIDVTSSRRSLADNGFGAAGLTQERDAETVTGSRGADSGEVRRGALADTDVATLLARLYRGAHTGTLVVTRAEAVKTLYLDEGQPVFATSNLPHDRMGDLLYREGKITREQHRKSREVIADSRRRMGELLVEMGFIKRRELMPAVRRHLEDLVYSLFAWSSGSFVIGVGEGAPNESIRLSRHPAAIIVEGVRRKYGLDLLESKLGGPGSVLAVPEAEALAEFVREVELGPAERNLFEAFDGERSLRDVARTVGVELLTVYQFGFALTALGVARLTRTSEQGEAWDEPVRPPLLVGATELAIDRQRVLAKYAHVNEADYFCLLGVRRDASSFEIKRAYEAARRDYAVESFPAEVRRELSRELDEIGGLLEEAYRVLRDDGLRTRYRQALRD